MPNTPSESRSWRPRDGLILAGFGVAFLLAHQIGLRTISPEHPLSPVWPPSGVLLASFLLMPRRLYYAAIGVVVLADIASNTLAGVRIGVGLIYLVPSLLELAIGLAVVAQFDAWHMTLRRVRDTFILLVAAVAGAAVSGILASYITVRTAPLDTSVWESFGVWWTADVLGIILVVPLIIAWARGAPLARIPRTRAAEGVVFLALWTWSAVEILHGHWQIGWLRLQPYFLSSGLVWAAFRLGIRGVSTAMTTVAAVAIWTVLSGSADLPWGSATISEQLFMVQVFLGVVGLTGLLLGSALAERRAASEVARETIDQLRALGDHLPAGIVAQLVTDPEGHARFVHVSAGVERILGVAAADVLRDASFVYERIVEEDRARFRAAELESRRALSVFNIEVRVRSREDEERWLQFSATSRRLDDGTIVSDGVATDVTDRRRNEDGLRRANRALRTISSCNQVLVRARSEHELLRDVCEVLVVDGGFRMAWVGYSEHDEGQRIRPMACAGCEPGYVEGLDLRWGDGEHDAGPVATALRTGRPVVTHDVLTDASLARWRLDAIARGYRACAVFPLRHASGATFGTLTVYAPDATAFDDEEHALLTELSDDLAYGIEAIRAREERLRAEAALAASEERFRQLAENIREIFWMSDARSGQTLYISPGVERMLGIPAHVVLRNPDLGLQLIHPDDRERVIAAFRRTAAGLDYDEQYRVIHPDGTLRWIHARAFPVRNAEGEIYRVVGVSDDITDRRRVEEQLRQVQKLEAIGQLAGGIAHDFNNILAAIMMQAGTARSLPGVPADAAELLQDVEASAQRASNLTRQLLLFSRKSVMRSQALEVNDLVAGLARMLRRIVPETHRLQLSLHPRALHAIADPGMLEQVVMNLTLNARDAMPDGGELAIETFDRELTANELRAHPDASPGPFVGIRVRDSGTGIAPEVRRHIFEPFFTTKEPGRGTGLGLATVFGIAQQHHGLVLVDSEVGRGSTFEVLIPAAPGVVPMPFAEPRATNGTGSASSRSVSTTNARPTARTAPDAGVEPLPASEWTGNGPRAATATAPTAKSPAAAPHAVILVVEDDGMLRAVLRRVLEQHGYRVHLARTGREALQDWEHYDPRPDLLLTDMVMPDGVGGAALAAQLQQRVPGLKVVYSSGYDPEYSAHSVRLEPGVNFLQKPATPHQIIDIVSRQLHDR
jgi:PAS domain S-box-containing protein